MRNLEIKNIKSHPSLSLAKANASRDLQINFNQAEDALTIPTESRHDHKCGFATQRGRSMIEMLGVLAIIGVLSVGGIAGYSKAMSKYRINKTIEQITLIAGNVRAFWGPQKNYIGVRCYGDNCNASGCYGQSSNDGCPVVKKAKIFPDEMITVTDGKIMSITNPFGGGVSLDTAYKSKSGDEQAFVIVYQIGDNVEACIELLSQDWAEAKNIVVNIYDDNEIDYYFKSLPIAVDKATEKCAEVIESGSDLTSLFFYFDVDPNSEFWKEQNWAD
ncbi:MAG: prepilin-type N-terminal cleavage/methylation domain-containing protein [Alphaproteobacteria bacterium]|nr:prepilin-type N-terminal cleavage/methylation domain-containing protein [Alphaproteobacteria bacterium]